LTQSRLVDGRGAALINNLAARHRENLVSKAERKIKISATFLDTDKLFGYSSDCDDRLKRM